MLFHRNRRAGIEQQLRDARPRAPHELLDQLTADQPAAPRSRNGYRTGAARLAVVGIATIALAAIGGIGFAASTAIDSAKIKVEKVATGTAKNVSVTQATAIKNAANDQYGDGSNRVVNAGPPVLGTPARPRARLDSSGAVTLSTTMKVSESGTLLVSVTNTRSNTLKKLVCSSTLVDGDTPNVCAGDTSARFQIERPRTLKIAVTVAAGEVTSGENLTIRLAYTDRDNTKNPRQSGQNARIVPATAPTISKPIRHAFTLRIPEAVLARIQAEIDTKGTVSVMLTVEDTKLIGILWKDLRGENGLIRTFTRKLGIFDKYAVLTTLTPKVPPYTFEIVRRR